MRGLDTLTHTQDDYRNPRCACAPRVNKGGYYEKQVEQEAVYPTLYFVYTTAIGTPYESIHTFISSHEKSLIDLLEPHLHKGTKVCRVPIH